MRTQRKSVTLGILVVLVLAVSGPAWAAKGGDKGKPGGDPPEPPPELPNVRYTILRIPAPDGTDAVCGVNSDFSMVFGNYRVMGDYTETGSTGFLYSPATDVFYDLNQLAPFFQVPESLPTDWWTTWHIQRVKAVNELGDAVGNVVDADDVVRGYLLETGLNPDPATWTFQILPLEELSSDQIETLDINVQGDILGRYIRPEGSPEGPVDAYTYNPWTDEHPLPFGINLKASWIWMNNSRQVAGNLWNDGAFFDPNPRPGMPSLQILDDAEGMTVWGLNDNGVLCGTARMRIGGRGPEKSIGWRYNTQLEAPELEIIMEDGRPQAINSDADVVLHGPDGVVLAHTGTAEGEEQLWRVSDLISETDPERALWLNNQGYLYRLTDRDETGFSKLAGSVWEAQPDGTNKDVAVVLIPFVPDPPQ